MITIAVIYNTTLTELSTYREHWRTFLAGC